MKTEVWIVLSQSALSDYAFLQHKSWMQKNGGFLSNHPGAVVFYSYMASSLCLELEPLQGMLVTGNRLYVLSLTGSSLLQGEDLDVSKHSVFFHSRGIMEERSLNLFNDLVQSDYTSRDLVLSIKIKEHLDLEYFPSS